MRGSKSKAPRRFARLSSQAERPAMSSAHAEELMELAVEAAQSRHLPEFLERFAERAGRMLEASWSGVTVFRGRETDVYATRSAEQRAISFRRDWLISCARESGSDAVVRMLPGEVAEAGADEGRGSDCECIRVHD